VSIPISLLNLIVPFALVRFAAQLPLILSLLVFLRLAAVLLLCVPSWKLFPQCVGHAFQSQEFGP